jgi:hypothetical protein
MLSVAKDRDEKQPVRFPVYLENACLVRKSETLIYFSSRGVDGSGSKTREAEHREHETSETRRLVVSMREGLQHWVHPLRKELLSILNTRELCSLPGHSNGEKLPERHAKSAGDLG